MRYILLLLYIAVLSLSWGTLWLLRPIKYVDNFESRFVCKNGMIYQIGPSVIFSRDGKIDSWNDKKARKLCAYEMILDYYDSLKIPTDVNYRLAAVFLTDSSWWQAVFAFGVLGGLGILGIGPLCRLFKITYKFNLVFVLIVLPLSFIVFALFFIKPFNNLYCERKSILITADFRRAVNKSGKLMPAEEKNYISEAREKILKECMKRAYSFNIAPWIGGNWK